MLNMSQSAVTPVTSMGRHFLGLSKFGAQSKHPLKTRCDPPQPAASISTATLFWRVCRLLTLSLLHRHVPFDMVDDDDYEDYEDNSKKLKKGGSTRKAKASKVCGSLLARCGP
jgi:hypothetical protein